MAVEHLLLFGFVEAVITALALVFIQRYDPNMIALAPQAPLSSPSILKPATAMEGK